MPWYGRCSLRRASSLLVLCFSSSSAGCSSRCVRQVGAQSLTGLTPCLPGGCATVSISPRARDNVEETYGVIGMLECLRAPSTALGVAAAGDLPLSPSWGFGVSTSSRRNCELFIVRRVESLVQSRDSQKTCQAFRRRLRVRVCTARQVR